MSADVSSQNYFELGVGGVRDVLGQDLYIIKPTMDQTAPCKRGQEDDVDDAVEGSRSRGGRNRHPPPCRQSRWNSSGGSGGGVSRRRHRLWWK